MNLIYYDSLKLHLISVYEKHISTNIVVALLIQFFILGISLLPRPVFATCYLFLAHLYCKILALEGQSLKYSVTKLVTYNLYFCAGPGYLVNCCKLCCFLPLVSYLSLCGFARESCSFLVESYTTIIGRRSYVSCINIIELFDLPVCSF